MQAFVINLDRSQDRLTAFTRTAHDAGLAFERWPAVDATTLDDRSPIHACFLSHRSLWAHILDLGLPWAAVFEDDAVLSPRTGAVLNDFTWLPDADVVKVETMGTATELSIRRAHVATGIYIHRLYGFHSGTAGYLISRRGAETLLAKTLSTWGTADTVIFNTSKPWARGLKLYQLVPALSKQDRSFASTLGRTASEKVPIPSHRKIRRETYRTFRQALALLRARNPSVKVPLAS